MEIGVGGAHGPPLRGSAASVDPPHRATSLTQSPASKGVETAREPGTGSGFDLSEVRFGTPRWDRVFEGTLHRVEIWNGVALGPDAFESERTRAEWAPASVPAGGRRHVVSAASALSSLIQWTSR